MITGGEPDSREINLTHRYMAENHQVELLNRLKKAKIKMTIMITSSKQFIKFDFSYIDI